MCEIHNYLQYSISPVVLSSPRPTVYKPAAFDPTLAHAIDLCLTGLETALDEEARVFWTAHRRWLERRVHNEEVTAK